MGCGDLAENIENPFEAGVHAEAVVGPFRKVGLPEARETDEALEIAALRAPFGKIAFEFEHLLVVLFGLKRRARVWRVRVGGPNVDRTVDDMCMQKLFFWLI